MLLNVTYIEKDKYVKIIIIELTNYCAYRVYYNKSL